VPVSSAGPRALTVELSGGAVIYAWELRCVALSLRGATEGSSKTLATLQQSQAA